MTGYSTKTARSVTGASKRQIDGLVKKGIIIPIVDGRRGPGCMGGSKAHRFSFTDLVAIRTIIGLQKKGVKLHTLLAVHAKLQEYQTSFATAHLVVIGDDIHLALDEHTLISLIKKPDQTMINAFIYVPLGEIFRTVELELQKIAA
jgi:hypothetical protein